MKKLLLFMLFSIMTFAQNKTEVFFDFNKDFPNENSIQILNKWMNENKEVVVTKISGFCDSIDNSNYNKELAFRRINSVLNTLKENNITVNPNVVLENNGKDFKQSKIQSENRKVIIFYENKKVKPEANVNLSEKVKTSKKGDLIKLKNIYFENNSAVIVRKSEATLYELLKIMNENPKLKIEIQGHICCKRPDQKDEISVARAKAIYDFLIDKKIGKSRLTYKGYGVTRPVHPIPEKNAQEEDENRRVEIMIVEN